MLVNNDCSGQCRTNEKPMFNHVNCGSKKISPWKLSKSFVSFPISSDFSWNPNRQGSCIINNSKEMSKTEVGNA